MPEYVRSRARRVGADLRRAAPLVRLPMAALGDEVVAAARRLRGQDRDRVRSRVRSARADRLRRTLAGHRGGALKAGQFLSAVQALGPADPDDVWSQALGALQDRAVGMPWSQVDAVLTAELGARWRERFVSFDEQPDAAASIGQVHRARWRDGSAPGRDVAVKVQYPGAREAVLADLRLLTAVGRPVSVVARGLALPAILAELRTRLLDELDYTREAAYQRAFAAAYADGPAATEAVVPGVVHATPRVLVQDWLDGEPLARVARTGTTEQRDAIGLLYQRFLLSGPGRAGLLHTDPHPGNFRRLPDGRLGVLDFGSCLALPDGLPPSFGRLIRSLHAGSDAEVLTALRAQGLLRPGVDLEVARLRDYLAPFSEPARHERFAYSTDWLRERFDRVNDPRNPEFAVGLRLSIPPEQLFTFRVWLGIVGVLCQLGATVEVAPELRRWLPGFADGTA